MLQSIRHPPEYSTQHYNSSSLLKTASNMHSFFNSVLTAAGLFCLSAAQNFNPESAECIPYSRPNPIASQFPANVTGTINSTLAILPIPQKLARSIIPAEYGILNNAWQDLLPHLPKDMYPAL